MLFFGFRGAGEGDPIVGCLDTCHFNALLLKL